MVTRLLLVVARLPESEVRAFSLVRVRPERAFTIFESEKISHVAVARNPLVVARLKLIVFTFPESVIMAFSLVSSRPERNAILHESAFCARESVK